MRRILAVLAILASGALGLPLDSNAALSCSTVTRRGLMTPDGLFHGNRFREPVSINSSGDVMLISRPQPSRDHLYLYPGSGPAELVGAVFAPAPNGGRYTTNAPFEHFSVSDTGHIAFFATTTLGPAVFVRESGGSLETAVTAAAVSPAGGSFSGFPEVSQVNDAARVAFRGTVTGGTSGIFVYDAVSEVVSAAVLLGDTTLAGRQICSVRDIELANTDTILFTATTQLDCNAVETSVDGIFLDRPGGIETVVLVGDPSPVLGTSHGAISGPADLNGSEDVLFRTQLVGPITNGTVFYWDSATTTTSKVATIGETTPVGGVYRKFRDVHLDDDGDVFVSAKLLGPASVPFGLFTFSGMTATPALIRSDAPPSDQFTPPSAYLRFSDEFDVASDGQLAMKVTVKDSAPPRNKIGVIRCASPSGAFLDGEAFF
jgi:hypothetical protein